MSCGCWVDSSFNVNIYEGFEGLLGLIRIG